MADTITIGTLVIESNVSSKLFKSVQNAVNKFLKERPKDSEVLGNCTKISGQKTRKALDSLNVAMADSAFTVKTKSNGKPVVELMETTDNEYMGVTYKVKWGDTWDTIQNQVSRARNQYFEPGTIYKYNGCKKLLASATIKLPPVRIVTCKSRVSNRELLGEKYQVRVGDTVKSIFDRLVALRCDSSITMKSFLKLNNLPESILAPYMPLPPVLKLPKPKSVKNFIENGKASIEIEEKRIAWIYNDKFGFDTVLKIPTIKDANGNYAFNYNIPANKEGNATIGVGHKLKYEGVSMPPNPLFKRWIEVKQGIEDDLWVLKDTMVKKEIDENYDQDIKNAENIVNNTTVPLNQNQFDALASMAFNKGTINAVLSYINRADFAGACKAWGRLDTGELNKRRNREVALFKTPV